MRRRLPRRDDWSGRWVTARVGRHGGREALVVASGEACLMAMVAASGGRGKDGMVDGAVDPA